MPLETPTPDHDLLIELRTEMKGLREDFKDMANDTKERIVALETGKLDKDFFHAYVRTHEEETNKIQSTVGFLTKWFWIAWGAVAVLNAIVYLYLSYHK